MRRAVKFGVFEADLTARELRKNGIKIRLQEQPFQVLALLLENRGEVMMRRRLRQKLWPADTFVDFDNGLNTAINKIREALCDSAEAPRYVGNVTATRLSVYWAIRTTERKDSVSCSTPPGKLVARPGAGIFRRRTYRSIDH